jgi:DNA-binding CsgD family transcriptional regulator/N-acetylneuraminic acid mutarotase
MQITAELTEREREILQLIASGASNKEIAHELFISANTVKVHLRNIFAKIGMTSRTEAAVYAIREGLTQATDLPMVVSATQELPTAIPTPLETKNKPNFLWIAALVTVLLVGVVTFEITTHQSPAIAIASPAPVAAPQRWQELADLPTARSGLAVAVYENQIYAIGGETTPGVTGVMERYDAATDTWITLTSKPVPVADINAAVIGGKIYISGGRLASGGVTDILESYDPRRDQWERRAPLPVALSGYALAEFEGKLYVFGGWNGQKFLASVYEYDPDQDKWFERMPMPTARGFAGAAVAGGKIYVIGGTAGAKALAVNEEYLPERDTWSRRAPLSDARHAFGIASIADIIYVVGGEGDAASPLLPLQYVHQQDQWQDFVSPLSENWSHLGVIPTGTHIYVLGGRLGEIFTAQNWAYQAIYTIMIPIVP